MEYGAVILSKIDGVGLLKFLKAIAPVKRFGKEGILDDWVMPDEEHQKGRLERHKKSLGRDWETLFFDPKLQGQRTA